MSWGNWSGQPIFFLDGNNSLKQASAGFNGIQLSPGHCLFDPAGVPVSPTNPLPVQDSQAEAALALVQVNTGMTSIALGTPADTAYTGTGNGSAIAVEKGIYTLLSAGIPISGSTVSKILDKNGVNQAVVNSDGSQLVLAEGQFLSSPPTLTNAQKTALLTDNVGNLLINASATNGTAGTSINPPAGGAGILGYLSGIQSAVQGTQTVQIVAGTAGIGSVFLTANNAVIGGVTQSGNWVLSAGTALIGSIGGVFNTVLPTLTNGQTGAIQLDSSSRLIISPPVLAASSALIGKVTPAPTNTAGASNAASVTGTAAQLVAANTAKVYLKIVNCSSSVTIWYSVGGTAVVGGSSSGAGGSIPITPLGSAEFSGSFVPPDAISAISASGSVNVTVIAA